MGGVATALVERNTTLPTRYSKVFTTAVPYQREVEIHVLQGERPMARDNKTIGKFKLKGIRRAMAGVPQIEVTFDIDANGILKVSARDLDTLKEQAITITANDRMSQAEIDQAMRDAAQYAGQDQIRRDALKISADASSVLRQVQNGMNQEGKNLEKEEKKQLKKDCAELQKLLSKLRVDKVTHEELARIQAAKYNLEQSGARFLQAEEGK